MKHYKILPEHITKWTPLDVDPVLTEDDIRSLAIEWDTPFSELMKEVDEVPPTWFMIDGCSDDYASTEIFTDNKAEAVRYMLDAWDKLSAYDRAHRTEFSVILTVPDDDGCVDYDSAEDVVRLNIKPRFVSLDNGSVYDSDVDYLMQEGGPVEDGDHWEQMLNAMDPDTRDLVSELGCTTDAQFLRYYLLLAPTDLIVR